MAKVDELMGWCDELERLLKTETETATRFAAAIYTVPQAARLPRTKGTLFGVAQADHY